MLENSLLSLIWDEKFYDEKFESDRSKICSRKLSMRSLRICNSFFGKLGNKDISLVPELANFRISSSGQLLGAKCWNPSKFLEISLLALTLEEKFYSEKFESDRFKVRSRKLSTRSLRICNIFLRKKWSQFRSPSLKLEDFGIFSSGDVNLENPENPEISENHHMDWKFRNPPTRVLEN